MDTQPRPQLILQWYFLSVPFGDSENNFNALLYVTQTSTIKGFTKAICNFFTGLESKFLYLPNLLHLFPLFSYKNRYKIVKLRLEHAFSKLFLLYFHLTNIVKDVIYINILLFLTITNLTSYLLYEKPLAKQCFLVFQSSSRNDLGVKSND